MYVVGTVVYAATLVEVPTNNSRYSSSSAYFLGRCLFDFGCSECAVRFWPMIGYERI